MDATGSNAAWRLAAALARARTESDAAGAVARVAATISGAESARVWLLDHTHGYRYAGAWPEQGAENPGAPPDEVPRALAFGVPSVSEATAPFRSRLVVPLLRGPRPLGAVELLETRRAAGAYSTQDAAVLAPLLEAADAALAEVRERARKERGQIEAVVRLTKLFDLGRSLTAAAGSAELQSLMVDRVRSVLEARNAYLWILDNGGQKLSVVAASGPEAEQAQGWELAIGEGIAGQAAESGEPILADNPQDVPDPEDRPDVGAGMEMFSVAAVPLIEGDTDVRGVLEVVNREGDDPILETGDVALLEEVGRTAVVALGNARRHEAERRAGDLGALLETAQQLSASLDTGRITHTLVHQSAAIISYTRAAVGLYRNARIELAGVSGQAVIDETLPEMSSLRDIISWAAGLEEGFYVVQEDDGEIDTPRPEAREKFRKYFEKSGARSFLSVPLRDDEGGLGVFTLEAAEPYAFSGRDIEAAELLAAHATAALRNAILYQQIPLANVFQPWASRKRRLMSMSWARRLGWLGGAAVLAVILFAVPVPLRVAGEARVLPDLRRPVVSEVEGRVARVLVHEGDGVRAGQVVAVLDDTDYRVGGEDAEARYQVAVREQSRLRAEGRTADAAVEAARIEGLRAERDLWRNRLEKTRIRSPLDGTVATPRVEDLVGSRLERGDVFCEVVDPARQRVEITVPEVDAGLIAESMPVKVKLRAWPTRSYRGVVERVGVAATLEEGERVFTVGARLEDPPERLRSGMTGRAKITTGPASVARVALRRPARWLWRLIWGWLP